MELHQDSSPYINDLSDFPDAQQHNSTSPFDQFDFANLQSSTFPHTPSYNGSYHNSPYSAHSELSFGGDPEQFGLFDEEPAGLVICEDYDPSEYDPPTSTGLLMFDTDFMDGSGAGGGGDQGISVSVTPAFDYSPPSSNGGGDSGPDGQPRSRGSSVSSNPHNNNNHNNMSSPRLDVTQGIENMRFESPNWGTHVLPGVDRSNTPPHKPHSPPQLVIPDSSNASSGNVFGSSPPVINAPDGDGGLMGAGPQLHIVPATPISGGGGTSQPVPFQSTLETLHQAGASSGQQQTASSWDQQTQQQSDVVGAGGMQYPDPAQLSYNFPGHGHSHSHDVDPRGLSTSNTQVHPNNSNNNINATSNHNLNSNSSFLFPIPPRSRRKSDTDLQPPHWGNMSQDQHISGDDRYSDGDNAATVNLSDILPSQQLQHHQAFVGPAQQPHLAQHFTFGPPPNNFLSPDMGSQLRRSKSDGASRPGHQRQSRSEDIYSTHMPFPPSSQQEFITRQFLHPQEGMPHSIRGHARRASSGSRGVGGTGIGMGGGAVEGSWSNASSSRPSPYPSPSASPRYRVDELPGVGMSAGRQAPMLQHEVHDIGVGQRMEQSAVVSKPNVTTGRTANASRIRRKQEANFMCPVPGCGSTFTRSFNLKGHMRSHNEEKPFQCKWPGCGKGFARQHDCKRHEQLHSNYRPFTCDGCSKNFARMDALNRHLRSEGGAECQRVLHEAQGVGLGLMQQQQQQQQSPPITKTEDNGWPGMSVML